MSGSRISFESGNAHLIADQFLVVVVVVVVVVVYHNYCRQMICGVYAVKMYCKFKM